MVAVDGGETPSPGVKLEKLADSTLIEERNIPMHQRHTRLRSSSSRYSSIPAVGTSRDAPPTW